MKLTPVFRKKKKRSYPPFSCVDFEPHIRQVEPHFESDICRRSASSPFISRINDCGAGILRRMRTGEMDGPNEPSSQGVSSRVPVDHCWCQWPRHRCFIITLQRFCCCAENRDQSRRTAAVARDRKRLLIKSD